MSSTNAGTTSGAPATASGGGGASAPPANSSYLLNDPKLREILLSDVGVEALLTRLKQSIYTTKEIAAYIKKMATIEVEHSSHLKKASRMMSDLLKRPEVKKGTCQSQVINIMKSTDRYGDAGVNYIDTMHKIHDELLEVVRSMERQRKSVKDTAMRHEKNLLDMEREVEKAKVKYNTACEDLEKARTSDPGKSVLGFKSKSEEELHRRMTVSEVDYQQKVDVCQRTRQELVSKHRVDSVRKLQSLVLECDNALSLQLIRFANLFETLQLNRGFVIAPIKPQNSPTANLSIKDMATKIDSELDFYNFVCTIPKTKTVLNRSPVIFKKHPTLGGSTTSSSKTGPKATSTAPPPTPSFTSYGTGSAAGTPNLGGTSSFDPPTPRQKASVADFNDRKVSSSSQASSIPPPSKIVSSGTAKTGPVLSSKHTANISPPPPPPQQPQHLKGPETTSKAAPSAPSSVPKAPSQSQPANATHPGTPNGAGATTVANTPVAPPKAIYDPSKHGLAVYGTPLEDVLEYEEGTVPRVVYQCVQAIDNFGLEVEGIYRFNGNKDQVAEIRNEFDIDAASVDLLRPKDGVNDIHSVASALKQYFQALPDPLLTAEFHQDFLQAANIQDDVRRRDSVHAIINNLPDPNYTTLRYLVFHLYRVQERSDANKMDVTNLGIIWGPILMKPDHQNVGEMAVQSRALQTILVNAYAIFEAE